MNDISSKTDMRNYSYLEAICAMIPQSNFDFILNCDFLQI